MSVRSVLVLMEAQRRLGPSALTGEELILSDNLLIPIFMNN